LEPLAIGLGKARGRTPGFEALVDANAQVLVALHNRAAAEAESADERLHGLLTDQSGNPELTKMLGQLRVKFRRIALAYPGSPIIVERFRG
jgi:DNA-binding GntR family transcriptional regulator